jgi:glutamate carboxypeptidase
MPDAQRHFTYLQPLRDQMIEKLGRFVTIESGSREKEAVDRMGRALAPAFEELGFSVARIAETECGDHLIARRAGHGQGRLLALIHLDTVWPTGSLADNPFRVENGVAFGPASRDMKGGWVVLLSALRALRAAGWDGLAQTTVFMTADEQLGSPRGRRWIEQEARNADWALVMEPAREGGELVTQRGVVGAVEIDFHGLTTHALNRKHGASAILEAAHKIPELEGLSADEHGVVVSVGLVQAGSARQYVPAHAWLSVDLRSPSQTLAEETLAHMRAVLAEPRVLGTRAVMSGGITRPAFPQSEGTERLLQLARACGPAVGIDVRGSYTAGGSDGNFTAALGVPTLDGLGPEPAGGSGVTENVLVESFPRRAALLAGIIEGLPGLLTTE